MVVNIIGIFEIEQRRVLVIPDHQGHTGLSQHNAGQVSDQRQYRGDFLHQPTARLIVPLSVSGFCRNDHQLSLDADWQQGRAP